MLWLLLVCWLPYRLGEIACRPAAIPIGCRYPHRLPPED
jgi:hypothetical protein